MNTTLFGSFQASIVSSYTSEGPWEGPYWEGLGTGAPPEDRSSVLFPQDQAKGTLDCGEDPGQERRGGTPTQATAYVGSVREETGDGHIQASGSDFLCLSKAMHVSDVFTLHPAFCLLPSFSSDVYQEL